jgi:chromosome segregation ATPase
MTHLGKTGKTGKPTRSAFVAEQVSEIMIKVEPRVSELRAVNKELDGYLATLGKMQDLIENKKRHAEGIKIEFDQAKEDLLNQNPNADVDAFNKDLKMAIVDLESDYQNALASIDGVKQTIRVKRTTARGIEDRMRMYEQKVLRHMAQLAQAVRQRAAAKKAS